MYSTKKHNKMLRASIEHWSFRRYKFKNIPILLASNFDTILSIYGFFYNSEIVIKKYKFGKGSEKGWNI